MIRHDFQATSQVDVFRRALKNLLQTLRTTCSPEGPSPVPVTVIQGDAVKELQCLSRESADYVLTSPPYFNAIDYPRSHKFSQWWLWPDAVPLDRNSYLGLRSGRSDTEGWCPATGNPVIKETIDALRPRYPAAARSLGRYLIDLNRTIAGLARVLKPGGPATLILANNTCHGTELPIAEMVSELLTHHGFADVTMRARQIRPSRRRYPYGIRGFSGLMTSEYVIHGRKTGFREA